ncbi:unnamed protein product [Arctia plantaginis]|uniref:Uncharacterized protein n=1 Tax=Arctia plantaginis TaxID=874455 RepID=A0A8S1BHW2_ARCPL|nr:unnamed protein product [Arctia plantaginis]
MDRMLGSNKDTESIYEIYRACRLCGGGAGYKMPIIQNIVDLDGSEVELKQKIRDCVQIEVHQDDKMPPLICELCVDKVNDFYEFLDMCRQTNKRTRLRLGLPPQSMPRGAPDAGDCILGVTEPIFGNEDSDGEPLSKHKKVKVKREPVVRIKLENLETEERRLRHKNSEEPERRHRHGNSEDQERSTRHNRLDSNLRVTRHSRSRDEDITLSSLKDKTIPSRTPKSILKKDSNSKTDKQPVTGCLKRLRDKDSIQSENPSKKVKLNIKTPTPPKKLSPKSSPRLQPKSKPTRTLRSPVVSLPKSSPSPAKEMYPCDICGYSSKTTQARASHLRSHTVGFTNTRLACNPCGDWFPTTEELATHQKRHKSRSLPYNCRICDTDFKKLSDYDNHFEEYECIPFVEVPDVKCDVCWHLFPTNNLLEGHKCLGEDNRPGGDVIINKELLSKLKPIQVRISRCDPLLANVKQEHYDVSCVSDEYGLDENCYYPYISGLRIKSEFRGMVDIHDEIKKEFCSEDYVHWDSDDSDSDDEITCNVALNPCDKKKRVPSLAALTLKTIFSYRFLGKVPRKRRKVKPERVFDSILTDQDEVRMDISSIIDNLGDDDIDKNNGNDDDDKVDNDRSQDDCGNKCLNLDDSDMIKESVVNNGVNDSDHNDKTDTVSSIDDSATVNDVIVDLNVNNEINLTKDNISLDSTDTKKNFNENNDNRTENSESNDNCTNDSLEKEEKLLEIKSFDSELLESNSTMDGNDLDSKSSITNYTDNSNLESNVNNNHQNNDSDRISNNDNDSIDDAMLTDELDKRSTESNINNSLNDNDNSTNKVINDLDDLINNSTEIKVGLSNIDDFNFDS